MDAKKLTWQEAMGLANKVDTTLNRHHPLTDEQRKWYLIGKLDDLKWAFQYSSAQDFVREHHIEPVLVKVVTELQTLGVIKADE